MGWRTSQTGDHCKEQYRPMELIQGVRRSVMRTCYPQALSHVYLNCTGSGSPRGGNLGGGGYLLAPCMRQHAAMLEDERGLRDVPVWALLLRPLRGLELHLAVDAREVAPLLQHSLPVTCKGLSENFLRPSCSWLFLGKTSRSHLLQDRGRRLHVSYSGPTPSRP